MKKAILFMFLAFLVAFGSVYSHAGPRQEKLKIELKVGKHRRKMPVRHKWRRMHPRKRVIIIKTEPHHKDMEHRH